MLLSIDLINRHEYALLIAQSQNVAVSWVEFYQPHDRHTPNVQAQSVHAYRRPA